MDGYLLLHGAGGRGAHWDLVARELRRHGDAVEAPDLPCEGDAPLGAYVDVAVASLDRLATHASRLVVVGASLSGLVAPLVASRRAVDAVVLVAAMVPRPGESGHEWWAATGHEAALAATGRADAPIEELFTHDVAPDVLAAMPPPRDQGSAVFDDPWPLDRWPDVATVALLCADDRFFPLHWLRAVTVDRLGVEPRVVPGGHCAHLSRPVELAAAIRGALPGGPLTR